MHRLVDLPDNFSQYIKNAKQNLCMTFIAVECTLLTTEGERNNSGVICDSLLCECMVDVDVSISGVNVSTWHDLTRWGRY